MSTVDPLVVSALALAGVACVVALVAILQVSKARKQLQIFRGTSDEQDILASGALQASRSEDLAGRVQRLSAAVAICQRDVAASLRHLAVVRFNAVEDMGGQFSFSAAILDDSANGMVLTSIQGHNQARIYAKTVLDGTSEHPLSPEEKQAIAAAVPRSDA